VVGERKKTMKNSLNNLAAKLFGITLEEAHEKGICVHCKQPALPKCYSEEGRREYEISGLCEACFDEITK